MESLHKFQDKIDYIRENHDAVYALAEILANNEETKEYETKSDVVQLLAAVSVYEGGLTLVLQCIEVWKERQNARYRFGPLIDELRQCENFSYVTTLTILVNCMLTGCENAEERIRLRNELLGLGLQETLDKLRMAPAVCDHTELQKQLDSFDERKMADDIQITGPDGVDLNSHSDIFDAIMKQVSQKPHEMLFLNILQHLLQIDSRDSLSDAAWEAAEKLVYRAKLISSKEEADKLLRIHTLSVDNNRNQCQCGANSNNVNVANSFLHSPTGATTSKLDHPHNSASTPQLSSSHKTPTPPPVLNGNGPPPMPPPLPPALFPLRKVSQPIASRPVDPVANDVPDGQVTVNTKFELPAPKQKLKTFAWNKLPIGKVANNGENVWSKAARNFNGYSLDFDSLETLFCQVPSQNSLERKNSSVPSSLDQKKSEINLLDSKRSLNVNIFLRQFKGDMQDLVELITCGSGNKIGLEKLRSLIKLMPEPDEVDTLSNYTDDKSKLGTAEKFLLTLIGVNNYQLRIEGMLLKEEFTTIIDYVKPSVQVIILAASDLKNNKSLQELLYLVLMVGNYLNSGGYGGNAAGFKVTSLWKLMEIRANKPNMTLLHYVVMEADKNNPTLLDFANQMKHLEDASKVSIDTIVSDFRSLKEKTDRISRQLSPELCLDVWKQMSDFLESAKRELTNMQRKIDEMERLRTDLAAFFCEDLHSFKLEDCLKIFQHFCTRFNKAIEENNERKIQEEKVEMRKKLKEQQQIKSQLSRDPSPYESSGGFIRGSYERRSLNTSRSHELLDVLNRSQENLDVDDNVITNSKVRRSLRRRVTAVNDLMGGNERERPVRPWRQRLEQLMTEEESTTTGGGRDRAKLRYSLDLSPAVVNVPDVVVVVSEPSTSSASTECSPIFARTYGRIETARISSVSDIRRPALVTPSISYLDSVNNLSNGSTAAKNEPSKATWRLDRDKRCHSLYNGGPDKNNCAEDLNELLQTLEDEKKEHANMIVGRRWSRGFRGSSTGIDSQNNAVDETTHPKTYKSYNNNNTTNIAEENNCNNNNNYNHNSNVPTMSRQYSSPSSPPGTRSRSDTADSVFQANGYRSWRDRIKEEIPDYTYSVDGPNKEGEDKNISENKETDDNNGNVNNNILDEVVRRVEKTRSEIEEYALTLETAENFPPPNVVRSHSDHLDSGIDLHSGSAIAEASAKSPLDAKESSDVAATENEPSTTECVVDFSLPPALDETTSKNQRNPDIIDPASKPPNESLTLVKPVIACDWRSPRSPEDQSDARSTESPTESVGDRDEGFETESHSTIALNEHPAQISPPSVVPVVVVATSNEPIVNRQRPRPNFMTSTKSSSLHRTQNNIDKQPAMIATSAPNLALKVKQNSATNGTFMKRMMDSISSKKTQTKLTSSAAKPSQSSTTKLPLAVVKPQQKQSALSRSNTNLSSRSSSSHDDSPARKPSRNNNAKNSIKSAPTAMKPTRTVASKQKQLARNRVVESLKENASSSDSERQSPTPQQKRIPPKQAAKVVDKKLLTNEKVYQRLLSPPPKVKRPSSMQNNLNEIAKQQQENNLPLTRMVRQPPMGHNNSSIPLQNRITPPPPMVTAEAPQGRRAPSLEPTGNKQQKKIWR